MKRNLTGLITGILIISGIIIPVLCYGQNQRAIINKYMTSLPSGKPSENGRLQKYRMTAVYTNMDIYGNITGKTKVTGDYTRGFDGGYAEWRNVFVAAAKKGSESFDEEKNQDFMENFRYIPSSGMMNEDAFKSFPSSIDNIFARNLIWDMLSFEIFAWTYNDSLKLNTNYFVPDIKGEFNMADIGKYSHASIQLCWTGISQMNNQLCASIEFRALNNKLELAVGNINTKGTEQYWGTIWISLKTKIITHVEMYSGTIQEVKVNAMKDKFLIKTIRELEVNKIQ